jgi:hypothetical protein
MNHAIIAYEIGKARGGLVWDWASTRQETLVMYCEKQLEVRGAGLGFPNILWTKTRERSVGQVKKMTTCLGDYTDEFARYKPKSRINFTYMCSSCDGYYSGPALVCPEETQDEQAIRAMETFLTLRSRLADLEIDEKPIVKIVKHQQIEMAWCYLLGFYTELPPTLFLSEDSEIVADFGNHCLAYPDDYRITEKW